MYLASALVEELVPSVASSKAAGQKEVERWKCPSGWEQTKPYPRGVKLSFIEGHVSLMVALKGPFVRL